MRRALWLMQMIACCSPVARGATDVLPYDGRHILEIHGYSSATLQSSVERYAQDLNSHSLDPAVRCSEFLPFCLRKRHLVRRSSNLSLVDKAVSAVILTS